MENKSIWQYGIKSLKYNKLDKDIRCDVLIIGGGIAAAGDLLFDPIRETVNKRAMRIAREAVQIVPAELGNTAGVMGAALLMDN